MSIRDQEKFFSGPAAAAYDQINSPLTTITDNLHLMIRLVLSDLPDKARILCVGVGTGTEIIRLAQHYPNWKFCGIEPSADMLDICKTKLNTANLNDRCDLHHGYLNEITGLNQFDAVLCILVTHFILDDGERQDMFNQLAGHVKPGGYLINADISYDTDHPNFPSIFKTWQAMHKTTGASKEQLDNMEKAMKAHVSIQSPEKMKHYLTTSGLSQPIQFFQSLLIHGWYSRKS